MLLVDEIVICSENRKQVGKKTGKVKEVVQGEKNEVSKKQQGVHVWMRELQV